MVETKENKMGTMPEGRLLLSMSLPLMISILCFKIYLKCMWTRAGQEKEVCRPALPSQPKEGHRFGCGRKQLMPELVFQVRSFAFVYIFSKF